ASTDLEQREPLGPEPDPAAVPSEPLARLEQLPTLLERRRVPPPARRANDPEPAALRVEREPVTGLQRLRGERPELLRAVEATGQHEVRSVCVLRGFRHPSPGHTEARRARRKQPGLSAPPRPRHPARKTTRAAMRASAGAATPRPACSRR